MSTYDARITHTSRGREIVWSDLIKPTDTYCCSIKYVRVARTNSKYEALYRKVLPLDKRCSTTFVTIAIHLELDSKSSGSGICLIFCL